MALPVHAKLNDKRTRIIVTFAWDAARLAKVKAIPGRTFTPAGRGGPYWSVPLDMISARALRQAFDGEISWDPALLAWGRERREQEQGLQELAHATDLPLSELGMAAKAPDFAEWLRPYQRADVKFLSKANAINANEQGLGKTAEVIAAVLEAGLEGGYHLVSAPVTSHEVVWLDEITRWMPNMIVLASEDLTERKANLKKALKLYKEGTPFWLVVNPDMIRIKVEYEVDRYTRKKKETSALPRHPELYEIEWSTITVDEFHKMGLNNPTTQASRGLYGLRARRRWAMSGTPMGGRPLKLFGALKFLEPEEYTSKWRWAETWLDIQEVQIGRGRTAREIGGIKAGKDDEFYRHHSKHMVRHLKSEVLPQLPPKQFVDVWCRMTTNQAKQYRQFAADAELRIDEHQLTATGILAEYARLKFFATAYCDVEEQPRPCKACEGSGYDVNERVCDGCAGEGTIGHLKLKPTFDSGKLPYLMERLAECGIDPDEPTGDACAVVGSQSLEVVDMVHRYLNEQGIKAEKITGNTTKKGERTRIVRAFQAGGPDAPRVLVISTLAGGVSITLDRADTVHVLDETWVPDDQEQLIDRIHRASRIHQVTAYFYRTRGTVEEYIHEVNQEKAFTNESILDIRRNGFRALKEAA